MKEVALFSSGIGVNNKIVPHRLPFGKGGVSALEEGTDIIIDPTGAIASRRGTSLITSGKFHSGWMVDNGFYAVVDTSNYGELYKVTVGDDGSLLFHGIINTLTRGARVSFTPKNDNVIYWCNGYEHGRLIEDVNSDNLSNYVRPSSRNFINIPVGKLNDIFSGRLLIVVGNELLFSEYGKLGILDNSRNRIRLETEIQTIKAVETGVFVSDLNGTYFLNGTNPHEWTINKVLDYSCKGVNQDLINPSLFGFDTSSLSALFSTDKGQVIGFPDGNCINLIEKNLILPSDCGQSGAIMVVDETLILQS